MVVDDLQLPDVSRPAPSDSTIRTINGPVPAAAPSRPRNKVEFKDSERDRILGALSSCNWNRVQAAKMIGIPRRTFYRRLKEYGIL